MSISEIDIEIVNKLKRQIAQLAS